MTGRFIEMDELEASLAVVVGPEKAARLAEQHREVCERLGLRPGLYQPPYIPLQITKVFGFEEE